MIVIETMLICIHTHSPSSSRFSRPSFLRRSSCFWTLFHRACTSADLHRNMRIYAHSLRRSTTNLFAALFRFGDQLEKGPGKSTTSSPSVRPSPCFPRSSNRVFTASSPRERDGHSRDVRMLSNRPSAGFVQGFRSVILNELTAPWSRRVPSQCRCRLSPRGDR